MHDFPRQAQVGDLVICRLRSGSKPWIPPPIEHELVGQVVRQTDIMSEVITTTGTHLVRTGSLEVVQPGHVRDTHTGGGQTT
jgi:hypothetical protein